MIDDFQNNENFELLNYYNKNVKKKNSIIYKRKHNKTKYNWF